MCLINFQFQEHPNYKLILAANRDEFYKRPTAPARFWEDHPQILAGRDLEQMGTWLGITKTGKIAALTNYRSPEHMKAGKTSRGEIVKNYLAGNDSPNEYIRRISRYKDDYVGFNVLIGTADELRYYNNIQDQITEISTGTHGLSNHFLDTPWPKVVKGKNNMRKYLSEKNIVHVNDLFDILLDAEEATDEDLPDTGVGLELERKLSPLFIQMPEYGTRCSTVLIIDKKNNVTFVERTYQNGKLEDEKSYSFKITEV